jgi:hypothetical protein
MISLTALGISSLTKAKMDLYFNIYRNGVNATYYATDGNVSSVDGYYYASGVNLFDKNDSFNAIRLNELNGTTSGSTLWTTSNFIQVKPNTTYRLQYTINQPRLVEYDSNKNYVLGTLLPAGLTFVTFTTSSNTNYFRFSVVTNPDINTSLFKDGATSTTYEAFSTPTTTLNLTFLFGVGNEPDKATMDGYYQDYEEYLEYLYVCCNIFATQTISFETIYFDDGVSTEIEQLGSILIFTLIGFTLMIFGFASKRRIFNLLAVGAFVVLGFLLIEFVGFIIILFGLIFVNVYYTFFGEL